MTELQTWDLWYPKAAATGLSFARGKLDPTPVLWVHAAPDWLTVMVYEGEHVVARGVDLERQGEQSPMTRLWLVGQEVHRADRFPGPADLGCPIILPGGEVGKLIEWWNAADGSEWRWRVEFYNHK